MPRSLAFPFGRSTPAPAALETKDAPTQRASAGPTFVMAGTPYQSSWDVDRMVRDGYEKVIPVFVAIDRIADKIASWPRLCMQGVAPDLKSVDDPILMLLNGRANLIDGSADFLIYRIVSQLLLSKRGVFLEVTAARGGGFASIALLPANRTYPVPDPDTWISGFEVHLPNGDRQPLPVYDPAKKAGVLWIRKPHPTDPYSSVTPLEAAGISIDLDFFARLYNRNFMLNDGRPGQIVAVKGALSEEHALELRRRQSPGMSGAGRTSVIEADSVSVADMATSPRDAQYAELRSLTTEDLLMALGTPKSVLGNATGVTFDNADAEKENWLDVTVLSVARVVQTGLDPLTEGGYKDDRQIVFDTSEEPVLQRMHLRMIDRAAADYDAGRIPLATFWRIAGYDEEAKDLDGPGSRVAWLNVQNRAPIGDPDDVEKASELKLMAAAAPPGLPGGLGGAATPGAAGPDAPGVPAVPADPTVVAQGGTSALDGAAQTGADRAAEQDQAAAAEGKGLALTLDAAIMLAELKAAMPADLFDDLLADLREEAGV